MIFFELTCNYLHTGSRNSIIVAHGTENVKTDKFLPLQKKKKKKNSQKAKQKTNKTKTNENQLEKGLNFNFFFHLFVAI